MHQEGERRSCFYNGNTQTKDPHRTILSTDQTCQFDILLDLTSKARCMSFLATVSDKVSHAYIDYYGQWDGELDI
jgi:hypothetical protein